MDNLIIREARVEDCQAIRDLIQELADFEKMPEGPKINTKDLEKDGFGDRPLFQALVAQLDDKIIGYTMYYNTYSPWGGKSMCLEDLYVCPDYQKKGIGSLLFDCVAKIAVDTNCYQLDFIVLEWNPATNFYKHKGAIDLTTTEKWQHYQEMKIKLFNNNWKGFGFDFNIWNDNNSPVIKINDDKEINLNENCGILSDRIIETCSSFLTKCPVTGKFILGKCNLSKKNLIDISALAHHKHLQHLNISHNNLKDLSPLGCLDHLLYLNASYNKIKDVLKFNSPVYLTYVNLSHNKIKFIQDLSEFWSIVKLNLSHNRIEKITGLDNLRHLKDLNLSFNLIENVDNLYHLKIEELNLEYNCIKTFSSSINNESLLKTLSNLKNILLAHNSITSLDFLEDNHSLCLIDLKSNKLSDLFEISHLKGHPIYEIDLRGNHCVKWSNYKDLILFLIPHVVFIDGFPVTITERISAMTKFEPSVDLLASQYIRRLILFEQLNFSNINHDNELAYDESEPLLLILTGPSASRKIRLGLYIAETLSKNVRYCPSHTTREFSTSNLEAKAYEYFEREEFNEMAEKGEYLTIEELVGDNYGFHKSEIIKLKNENKIGITQMDLQSSIQMKKRYSNIKLIFILVKDELIHCELIEEKFKIFTWIKDSVDNLLALTITKNSSQIINDNEINSANIVTSVIDELINNLNISLNNESIYSSIDDKFFLPRKTKTRLEIFQENNKHITFDTDDSIEDFNFDQDHDELKIMLDEESNIIIDDEITKKKRKQAKVLYRRSTMNEIDHQDDEVKSLTSEESQDKLYPFIKKLENKKTLMKYYVDIVLKSRQDYIDYHLNNPGFYSFMVFTDKFETHAVKSLTHFIKNLKIKHYYQSSAEIKYLHDKIIPKKIDEFINALSSAK
ncbi:hypothetical protein HCN44_001588 [Aphidius gifuensis]|uniref:Uncharacterized protein n=1 Tax=Aphidius gifuensis TaxID=684658 RepID=A0A834XRT1_APHGI|nr:hypothetical protein HCN44_001588 [Aphidius gifuensis]